MFFYRSRVSLNFNAPNNQLPDHVRHFCSSSLTDLRCKVWRSQWRLLPHRVLQWLLEPSEGLLSHQRYPDKAPAPPQLLPAVLVALAAVCCPERSLTVEFPSRRHLRTVGWGPRLCQGEWGGWGSTTMTQITCVFFRLSRNNNFSHLFTFIKLH